jgi:hypothetical protein
VVGKGGVGALRRGFGAGHGGHRPDLGKKESGFFTVSLPMNTSRPFADQRLGLEDTLSRGRFLKETLNSLVINPQSIA